MLAAMADKMMEHFEPTSINAVATTTTACQENLQFALLSKQIEKLSLEIAELRTNQQSAGNYRRYSRFPHRNRSRSQSRSRQRGQSSIKPGDPNWLCRYHYRFGDEARKCEPPFSIDGCWNQDMQKHGMAQATHNTCSKQAEAEHEEHGVTKTQRSAR
ncbi:hypothetical protein SFRURICE_011131 [Spodoptera frugiperda]|nr:hypothetical protein SFRURICE_011131 [Spodoptera frugiperda]